MRKTILCLANSYKHGGRCIAGIDLGDGRWVRLRGSAPDGALCACESILDDGSQPRVLDVMEVEVTCAAPTDSHPEDWRIAARRWRSIRDTPTQAEWNSVISAAGTLPGLLRGCGDRLSVDEVHREPLAASLSMIQPEQIYCWIREEHGKRRHRALFRCNHVTYDLALTDPPWLDQLGQCAVGVHPITDFIDRRSEIWLTISLSEAYYGWHYKLIAGVIARPYATNS